MDLGTIFHVLITAGVMLAMICILVAAHEYGHYLFARLFGMGVEEFAIGFGRKPIWTYMRRSYDVEGTPGSAETQVDPSPEQYSYPTDGSAALQPEPIPEPSRVNLKLTVKETTDFTIRPWPLGGFVRIKGMVPEEDGSEVNIPGGFYSKAPWKRFIVLLAGPVFSVVAGILIIFSIKVAVGEDKPTTTLQSIVVGGPADKAGLEPGDKITNIGGATISNPGEVSMALRDRAGQAVNVTFERKGKQQTVSLTPVLEERPSAVLDRNGNFTGETKRQGKMMAGWQYHHVSVSPAKAFTDAVGYPVLVVTSLARLIPDPAKLKENVGGPISIAKATSDAVKFGPEAVIFTAALLSISVGIFNLLPIPPLDGGQMLVSVLEMLRGGRRLSLKVQGALIAAGFAMVLVIVVSVMMIDVGRLTNPAPPEKELKLRTK